MRTFSELYATAVLHKGSESAVAELLPSCLSAPQISALGDAKLLSIMCLRIFQAGLKHDLVAAKWPAFEQHFKQFDPFFCAMLSDEDIERALTNKQLIRHPGKLKSIRHNAMMVRSVAADHGSFAQFIAEWPTQDIVGLWRFLKKHGSQMGGASAPRFLRMAGKDTFVLTDDVVAVLKAEGVVDRAPSTIKELQAAQEVFNLWQEECGRPLCEISRVVSMNTW